MCSQFSLSFSHANKEINYRLDIWACCMYIRITYIVTVDFERHVESIEDQIGTCGQGAS